MTRVKTFVATIVIATFWILSAVRAQAQDTEQRPTAGKRQVLWDKLASEIREIDLNLDGVMGVAIEDLATGQKFFLHEDEVFPQGSSIKITVLAELSSVAAFCRGRHQTADDFFKVLSTHQGQRDFARFARGSAKFAENRPYVICVMTTYLHNERDGAETIARISVAAYRMFDRLSRASEYGRVVSTSSGNVH